VAALAPAPGVGRLVRSRRSKGRVRLPVKVFPKEDPLRFIARCYVRTVQLGSRKSPISQHVTKGFGHAASYRLCHTPRRVFHTCETTHAYAIDLNRSQHAP
jgi:hypothetical protein